MAGKLYCFGMLREMRILLSKNLEMVLEGPVGSKNVHVETLDAIQLERFGTGDGRTKSNSVVERSWDPWL